jgi:hypothetical protein
MLFHWDLVHVIRPCAYTISLQRGNANGHTQWMRTISGSAMDGFDYAEGQRKSQRSGAEFLHHRGRSQAQGGAWVRMLRGNRRVALLYPLSMRSCFLFLGRLSHRPSYRGRDSALACAAPPSEPCWRISRTRLSGRWFYLMRTGVSMLRTLGASERIRLKGVVPRVLACSASLHSGSPHSPYESIQHAGSLCAKAPGQDSHRLSPFGHSRGWKPITLRSPASTFLRPFAPRALPRFHATMDALTPARLALRHTTHEHQPFSGQVSLVHAVRTSMHSVTKHLTRPVIAYVLPAQRDRLPGSALMGSPGRSRSGLRLESAGSSLRTAESCSSSYGLHVRLRLLSTPPRGDAVTFDYRERASPGRGLAPLRSCALPGARTPASAGVTLYTQ